MTSAALILLLLVCPAWAWGYVDPGFGGYMATSVIAMVMTGAAFVCATVTYFLRNVMAATLKRLWQGHRKACLLTLIFALGLAGLFLGRLLYPFFYRSAVIVMTRLYFNPEFNAQLVGSVVCAAGLWVAAAAWVFRWQAGLRRKIAGTALSLILAGVCVFLAMSLYPALFGTSDRHGRAAVTRTYDAGRMFDGYTLYDGRLINPTGKTVKKWSHNHLGVIDNNGDYYGALHGEGYQGAAWGRYTWDEKPVWEKHSFIHHEIYLSPRDTVFTFTQETHAYNGYRVAFDVILEYDKRGRELQRYSFWDHLEDYRPLHPAFGIDTGAGIVVFFSKLFNLKLFDHPPQSSYDYFHLNSFCMVQANPLAARNPAFRPGNWLLSLFHGSMVVILDQDTKKIVWHAAGADVEGALDGQHAVSMLPDGGILLYDNGVNRASSRILIIDPLTMNIRWEYKARNFWSAMEGYVQYLPNGNFLVTESMLGRIFELTPQKTIVWEHDLTGRGNNDIYRATRYGRALIDRFMR